MPPKNKYRIVWENENLEDSYEHARTKGNARILARAEKIRAGLDDRIKEVVTVKDYTQTIT